MLNKDSNGEYIYAGKYPREAYEQAVVDGITSQWSGDYKGKNIITQFTVLKEPSSIQKAIYITIDGKNGKSTGSRLKKKEIKMHICNGMNVYNLTELGLIAAQEFGHTAFDLDDLYNKSDEGIPKTILSVMNDAKRMPRQEVDFAMMATNKMFKGTSIYNGEVNGVKVTPLDVARYYVGL
jgi:hypothetical protein